MPRYFNGENTKLLFIRGLRSWTEIKMRRHLKKIMKEFKYYGFYQLNVLLILMMYSLKIKIVGNEEEIASITECIINSLKGSFN